MCYRPKSPAENKSIQDDVGELERAQQQHNRLLDLEQTSSHHVTQEERSAAAAQNKLDVARQIRASRINDAAQSTSEVEKAKNTLAANKGPSVSVEVAESVKVLRQRYKEMSNKAHSTRKGRRTPRKKWRHAG